MNTTEIRTTCKMINALLDCDTGNLDVAVVPGWRLRADKSLGTLMLTITHAFPHPDGRWHRSSKQTQLGLDSDTKDFVWMWMIGAVQALVLVAVDANPAWDKVIQSTHNQKVNKRLAGGST